MLLLHHARDGRWPLVAARLLARPSGAGDARRGRGGSGNAGHVANADSGKRRASKRRVPAARRTRQAIRCSRRCSRSTTRKQFGGLVAVNRVSFEMRTRRDPRPDRPERRRQEHDVQPDQRLCCRLSGGEIRFAGRPDLAACCRRRSPGSASRARFQHVKLISPDERCSTTSPSAPRCAARKGCVATCLGLDRAEEDALMREAGAPGAPRRADGADAGAGRQPAAGQAARGRDRPRALPPIRRCCCSTSRPPGCASRRSRNWRDCCARCATRA